MLFSFFFLFPSKAVALRGPVTPCFIPLSPFPHFPFLFKDLFGLSSPEQGKGCAGEFHCRQKYHFAMANVLRRFSSFLFLSFLLAHRARHPSPRLHRVSAPGSSSEDGSSQCIKGRIKQTLAAISSRVFSFASFGTHIFGNRQLPFYVYMLYCTAMIRSKSTLAAFFFSRSAGFTFPFSSFPLFSLPAANPRVVRSRCRNGKTRSNPGWGKEVGNMGKTCGCF